MNRTLAMCMVFVIIFAAALSRDDGKERTRSQAELLAWYEGYKYGRYETIMKFQECLPESTFSGITYEAERDGLTTRELRHIKVIPKTERKVLIP